MRRGKTSRRRDDYTYFDSKPNTRQELSATARLINKYGGEDQESLRQMLGLLDYQPPPVEEVDYPWHGRSGYGYVIRKCKCLPCMEAFRAYTRDYYRRRRGKGFVPPRQRTTCSHGHPFDDENTGWRSGKRYCRECNRVRTRAHYYRQKAS